MSIMRVETGMSENNLRHWGELEVIKEFVQNMVYAKSILGDEFSITYDKERGVAVISNSPSGFDKGKLLIGESDQAGVEGAPGEYGEGTKVAMCVGERLGMDITIRTNGFTVVPKLVPSLLDPNVRALVMDIEDTEEHTGTHIELKCSEEKLEEAKKYFAILNNIDPETTKTNTTVAEVKDTVFVNGVKITEVPSIFSYNFTSTELMNRDRTSLDIGKVKSEVKKVLARMINVVDIKSVLSRILEDSSLLESQTGMYSWDMKDEVSSHWKLASASLFGTKCCIATGNSSDTRARYLGFNLITNIPHGWKSFFNDVLGIKYSDDLEQLKPKNVSVKPKGDESANLGWSKRLISLYYGDYGTVKVSDTVVDAYGNQLDGMYDPQTDIIWIRRSLLDDKKATFKTLLHETVHRVTGADDNTEAFTRGFEEACWGILNRRRP